MDDAWRHKTSAQLWRSSSRRRAPVPLSLSLCATRRVPRQRHGARHPELRCASAHCRGSAVRGGHCDTATRSPSRPNGCDARADARLVLCASRDYPDRRMRRTRAARCPARPGGARRRRRSRQMAATTPHREPRRGPHRRRGRRGCPTEKPGARHVTPGRTERPHPPESKFGAQGSDTRCAYSKSSLPSAMKSPKASVRAAQALVNRGRSPVRQCRSKTKIWAESGKAAGSPSEMAARRCAARRERRESCNGNNSMGKQASKQAN